MTPENIRKKVEALKDSISAIREAAHSAEAGIHKKIGAIRKLCPHERTTYNPDPSGNNDSWTECDDCGKIL